MKRIILAMLGVFVFSGGLVGADTAVNSYCQVHCKATDVRAQIGSLEKEIRRDQVSLTGTKSVVAFRIRGESAKKEARLAELKKRLAELEIQLASVKE